MNKIVGTSYNRMKDTLLAEGYWQDALSDAAIVATELEIANIVFEKRVNLKEFYDIFVGGDQVFDYDWYEYTEGSTLVGFFGKISEKKLTKEEFNLILGRLLAQKEGK